MEFFTAQLISAVKLGSIYALVALVGCWEILAGGLTVGGLTVLLYYANQYFLYFTSRLIQDRSKLIHSVALMEQVVD